MFQSFARSEHYAGRKNLPWKESFQNVSDKNLSFNEFIMKESTGKVD